MGEVWDQVGRRGGNGTGERSEGAVEEAEMDAEWVQVGMDEGEMDEGWMDEELETGQRIRMEERRIGTRRERRKKDGRRSGEGTGPKR